MIHGWVILDKPLGLSSNKATSTLRRLLKTKKAGYVGTLDPLATGILPIAFGEATKTIAFYEHSAKQYRFTVQWGSETSTDDKEGAITQRSMKRPSLEDIQKILPSFSGVINQTPPSYSAIKIQGVRAYKLARDNDLPLTQIPERRVQIFNLVIEYHNNETHQTTFLVDCGPGTYVRSLGRDMGRNLGCFGHIDSLRRTKVGKFDETSAFTLEILAKIINNGEVGRVVLPIGVVLDDIPAIPVSEGEVSRLRKGQLIQGSSVITHEWGALYHNDMLVCIASQIDGQWAPKRVFVYEKGS